MNLHRISLIISKLASSTAALILSIVLIVVWFATGPIYDFSERWLIAITVITDVIMFVMVFSIQNTQFRDSKAIQLKLNELIAADKKARDTFIGLEALTDAELSVLDDEFKKLLSELEVHPAMHKLHATIKETKNKRPTFYEQAGHLAETIFSSLNVKDDHKK